MNKSKIEWTNYTWNPISGCYHDCEYCYARKIAKRFSDPYVAGHWDSDSYVLSDKAAQYVINPKTNDGHILIVQKRPIFKNIGLLSLDNRRYSACPFGFCPTLHMQKLNDPTKIKKPQNVFVCSMADLFGEWVPDEWIKAVFEACERASQHNYLFLTKNPKRYETMASYGFFKFWFGVSASGTQTANEALYYLGKLMEFQKTFLSIEPLHNEIKFAKNFETSCDWVIVGAETGNRKNKVIPERKWIESIVEQCKLNNIPLFMKNNLKDIWGESLIQEFPWD